MKQLPIRPTDLARAAGISIAYAHEIMSGKKTCSPAVALRIESVTDGKIDAASICPAVRAIRGAATAGAVDAAVLSPVVAKARGD